MLKLIIYIYNKFVEEVIELTLAVQLYTARFQSQQTTKFLMTQNRVERVTLCTTPPTQHSNIKSTV